MEIQEYSIDDFARLSQNGELPARAVPALLAFYDGNLIGRIVGMRGKAGEVTVETVDLWLDRLYSRIDDLGA